MAGNGKKEGFVYQESMRVIEQDWFNKQLFIKTGNEIIIEDEVEQLVYLFDPFGEYRSLIFLTSESHKNNQKIEY